ncbi:MAG: redox-sensing transcriptional repressor Rex, partial [Planctomycetes bacterium]|nr:redox-sensing transcriptional repressor Rex [Planctomycetota bacterium]
GVGYRVEELIRQLRRILKTDRFWPVVVVGAGDLGRALLRHKGFLKKGFKLVAAVDVSPRAVGAVVGDVTVRHIRELPRIVAEQHVHLAVLAVPAETAQDVTDMLCRAGIKGILNFAPTSLRTPPGVIVRQVDVTAHLEQLSFHVSSRAR